MSDPRKIKCVIWDLDGTLWSGTLLEGDDGPVRDDAVHVIRTLDERGILHSIASRNHPENALRKLREAGIDQYFLYPQIGWTAKSAAIAEIRARLNLGLDALAFVDDQPYERAEVSFALPQVMTVESERIGEIVEMDEFRPRFVTEDSRARRALYRLDERRKIEEDNFSGPSEEFLRSLDMRFTISRAAEDDLQRAEELTVRTHQLNTTGQTYGYDELAEFMASDRHLLLMADLEDRFGPYGKIGLALVEKGAPAANGDAWRIKLLLMSCRVAGRGVGTVMLHHVMQLARAQGAATQAEFRPNGRNDMMRVTLRFAGFREVSCDDGLQLLEAPREVAIPPAPQYLRVLI